LRHGAMCVYRIYRPSIEHARSLAARKGNPQ
jgi:hypothetical protein